MNPAPPEDGRLARLDVALVCRRSVEALLANSGGVVVAGIALVIVPAALAAAIGDGRDLGTLLATLRGVLAMLYVVLVSWGVMARLRGRALPPRLFLREGLARATPGLQVALLAGAAVGGGLIIHLFARHGTFAGWLLDVLLLSGALLAICVLMPLVPAAVAERLGPVAAFRRAAALTAGHRNRILGLALIIGLTVAPPAALASAFGPGGAGPWLMAVVDMFSCSVIAAVPAVVYAGLREVVP